MYILSWRCCNKFCDNGKDTNKDVTLTASDAVNIASMSFLNFIAFRASSALKALKFKKLIDWILVEICRFEYWVLTVSQERRATPILSSVLETISYVLTCTYKYLFQNIFLFCSPMFLVIIISLGASYYYYYVINKFRVFGIFFQIKIDPRHKLITSY